MQYFCRTKVSMWCTSLFLVFLYIGASLSAEIKKVDCSDYVDVMEKSWACCKHEEDDDLNIKDQEEECEKRYGDLSPDSTPEQILEGLSCVSECTFNGTNLMTEDMKINSETFLHAYDNSTDSTWKNLWSKSVKICLEKIGKEVKGNSKCKSGMINMISCMMEEINTNCPAELLDATRKECADFKSYNEKCSFSSIFSV